MINKLARFINPAISTFKFSVHYTSRISGENNIIIENNCPKVLTSFAVSGGCYICALDETNLYLGKNTIFAPNVCIQTGNHNLIDRDIYEKNDIVIGRNCWLGFGSVVLKGVTLGDNVIVGANSVVTKSFPSNVVVAGCPAKVIRMIDVECVE